MKHLRVLFILMAVLGFFACDPPTEESSAEPEAPQITIVNESLSHVYIEYNLAANVLSEVDLAPGQEIDVESGVTVIRIVDIAED